MRQLNNLEALFEQCEFFVDVVSGYGCDFAYFQNFPAPLWLITTIYLKPKPHRELEINIDPIHKRFKN
jgi:hypothetical protein